LIKNHGLQIAKDVITRKEYRSSKAQEEGT
jgi:hypothetical protein